jgi:hypothetical protein
LSERWVWVSTPSATFALCVRDGHVVDAPPYGWSVVRRLRTSDWRIIARWLQQRGAVFAELDAWRDVEKLPGFDITTKEP